MHAKYYIYRKYAGLMSDIDEPCSSQLVPIKPSLQTQKKLSIRSIQAPLTHGLGTHSLRAVHRVKKGLQVHETRKKCTLIAF